MGVTKYIINIYIYIYIYIYLAGAAAFAGEEEKMLITRRTWKMQVDVSTLW